MANEEKDLGIILSFFIDESKEINDINNAIKNIESKISKLNLQIGLDNESLKHIHDSIKSINKIGTESFDQIRQETIKATQSSEKHKQQLEKEAEAVRNLAKETENLRRVVIKRSGDEKIRQQQITKGDNFEYKTITGYPMEDRSFVITGITEVFDKEKLIEAKKYYEDFSRDFTARLAKVQEALGPTNEKIKALTDNFGKLNERSSKTDFNRVQRQLRELEKETKNYYDMLKLEDRAWRENLKRDEDFINSRKKLENDIADIRRRFGADPEVIKSLDGLEKKLMSISNVGNYKKAFTDINTELKNIKANANTATSHIIGFGEAMRTAFVKFPVWLASGTIIMQTIRFFEYGLRYTVELDSKLNEIAIVLGKNQDEVRGLAKEYNNLAKELRVTTREVAEASVEYYRQGLNQEEVMKRLQTTTQYAKISSLQFKESAEILTATVNSMGVDIERASDVFAYLGEHRPLVA